MIKLFSYGTLWKADTQKSVFGTTFEIDSDLDYINGWNLTTIKLHGFIIF